MSQTKQERSEVKKVFEFVERSLRHRAGNSGDQSRDSDIQGTNSPTMRKRPFSKRSGSGDGASSGRATSGRSEHQNTWPQPRFEVGDANSDLDSPPASRHLNKRPRTAGRGHIKSNGTTIFRHQLTARKYLLHFLESAKIRHTSQESLEGFQLDTSEVVAEEATWSEGLQHEKIWLYVPEGVAKESCSIFAVRGLDYAPSEKDEREILETAARAPRKENKENSLTVVVYYNKEGKATKVTAGFLGHQLPNEVNRPVEEVRGLQPEFVRTLINKLASNKGPWIIS